ncbi:MAG: pseudouridine synthase [Roseimicrobium sp.]
MKLRRLDQLLASLGHGSRREVKELIAAGLVTVGGVVTDVYDAKVEAHEVRVQGEPLEAPDGLIALFHKPVGYVCTHAEREGPTIYDLLPPRWLHRNPAATSIGRLDKDTSGVLLLTDRGDLVQRWTSPKSEIEKVYEVEVDLALSNDLVEAFSSGELLLHGENKACLPAQLVITGEREATLTLTEGRYHQVRRMFASLGWTVTKLHRSRFGEFTLSGLAAGEWREVSAAG